MKKILFVLTFSLLSCVFAEDISNVFIGKCVKVYDGDTITVMNGETKEKIRLYAVDAPELKQAFGDKSREFTSNTLMNKEVKIVSKGKDMYGRTIGLVVIGEKNFNEELVKTGWAWHYKAYSKEKQYDQFESQARKEKKGLWKGVSPIPPWNYRKKIFVSPKFEDDETTKTLKLKKAEKKKYVLSE